MLGEITNEGRYVQWLIYVVSRTHASRGCICCHREHSRNCRYCKVISVDIALYCYAGFVEGCESNEEADHEGVIRPMMWGVVR